MFQHDPHNRKRRFAVKTILLFGEGLDDKMFLKHLQKLYCSRNAGVSITVKKGKGGDPTSIVIDVSKESGDFSRRAVFIDNDKSQAEMEKGREEAKKRNIELIENTPCLEGFLLLTLGDKKTFSNSHSYKSEFEKNYISEDRRDDSKEYEKVFPKELLERRRLEISALDALIKIFEGK